MGSPSGWLNVFRGKENEFKFESGAMATLLVDLDSWRVTLASFPSCRVPFTPDHCTVAVFSYK